MKVNVRKEIEVMINLSEEEAWYLKDLLQNDLSGCETVEDNNMREHMFTALKIQLEDFE